MINSENAVLLKLIIMSFLAILYLNKLLLSFKYKSVHQFSSVDTR